VTGVSGGPREGAPGVARYQALANGGLFIAGFSTIFIALGASATAIGSLLRDHAESLARAGGVILLVLGLHLVGLLRIPGFERDVRALDRVAKKGRLGYASSYAVGAAFGAGWTPCIGPVLAGILTLAATSGSLGEGMALLTAYSLGLAIPFLLATLALDRFLVASRRTRRAMPWINRISGVLLLVLGVILVSGAMTQLSAWFAQFTPAWLE
ncbi:MAG: cytochrome c biogenesis CcdA family protein, partial [Gaiellaceae bacterium]